MRSIIRNLVRVGAVLLGVAVRPAAGWAQPARPADPAAAALKQNIAIINREDGAGADLIEPTVKQLVAYLKSHELSAAQARQLGLELSVDSRDAARFRVYTFAYDLDNSRGAVHFSVMQWQNPAGQRFAYAPAVRCAFSSLHRLRSPGRTQYLLLGQEKGSAGCMRNLAYVVELKGNYLLLDTPAFDASPSLDLCNVWMEFDARRQLLRLDAASYLAPDEYQPDEESYRLLTRWGFRGRPAPPTLTLRFNGQRFVRP